MLNGIDNKDGILNSQLDRQSEVSKLATNPIKNAYANTNKSMFIDETAISSEAVNLYEKEQDVKKFTNLAMSDPDDLSHEQIIDNLFSKGVTDPFSDDVFSQLSNNQKLLDDLSL